MLMYHLTKHGDNHSKTFGSLQQYHRDDQLGALVNSESFKCKMRITEKNPWL